MILKGMYEVLFLTHPFSCGDDIQQNATDSRNAEYVDSGFADADG